MKVSELIEKLKEFDGDSLVVLGQPTHNHIGDIAAVANISVRAKDIAHSSYVGGFKVIRHDDDRHYEEVTHDVVVLS